MNRLVWFLACAILGLVMLACGLMIPAHLRAVDVSILQQAGRNTPTLAQDGLALVADKNLGAAQVLLQLAQEDQLPGRENLEAAVTELSRQHPGWVAWGGPEPSFESIFQRDSRLPEDGSEDFTEYVLRLENRERVLQLLQSSPRPLVQELLRTRGLNHTVILPPSSSSAGQAFDAALSVCGLLAETGHLTSGLSNAVLNLTTQANAGANSQPFEEVLVDFMSLGQRFNWGRLVVFLDQVQDTATLRRLANFARRSGKEVPVLFSALHLSHDPKAVANYLVEFSQTGLKDLGASLRYGTGGVSELLRRNQRLCASTLGGSLAGFGPLAALYPMLEDLSWRSPEFGLALKWSLYLLAGFLLAAAVHFALPAVTALQEPLQVRGFHLAREVLFAFGFLLVVLLLSEPFLSQESQRMDFPIRLRLPIMGKLLPAGTTPGQSSFMNQLNMLTLLLFFVLPGCSTPLAWSSWPKSAASACRRA